MASTLGVPNAPNSTGWGTADLYVNYDSDASGTFELVSPDVSVTPVTVGTTVTPNCDLDLLAATHAGLAGVWFDGQRIRA